MQVEYCLIWFQIQLFGGNFSAESVWVQKTYILVGALKVTHSYQVLKNGLEDVTNDVRDCPGGGPCYVLVYVGLEAGLVTQSEDSLFCPQQKWTFHLFLHFDSADF